MTPISDFTNCNANHCPYSKLHDFGPCKIEYMYFVMTPRVLPTPVPTCAPFRFYQLQCQPLPIFEITWFRTMYYRIYVFRYDTKSFTNPSANLCPIPILPTAMPTTAHIRNYMISDHVESNICISLDTKSFTNPSANLCPFPILPTAMPTTAHIRNYMISDHVESNICISLWHQEFYQPQCQPVPISDFTNCNAHRLPIFDITWFWTM
jgi:hypothetical protein